MHQQAARAAVDVVRNARDEANQLFVVLKRTAAHRAGVAPGEIDLCCTREHALKTR